MFTALRKLVSGALVRRVVWHAKRVANQVDGRFFAAALVALVTLVTAAAVLVTALEREFALRALAEAFYWALTTVLGQGDSTYVETVGGFIVSWVLVLFGVAVVAAITGALVGFVIDILLKEGQGMGASGYTDHIVVCGWNSTARELVKELRSDGATTRVVVLHDVERNPAGDDIYFVRGDSTDAKDLRRAGVEQATVAIVCPADAGNDADMRSILTVMAVESVSPQCRTVVEVNNPDHVPHFQRTNVDEILVTSRLASRLLARTALYPGLGGVVADMVSGGDGCEMYRIELPHEALGLDTDELAALLRRHHDAALLAVDRDGRPQISPPEGFRTQPGDTAVVVAESLKALQPAGVVAS